MYLCICVFVLSYLKPARDESKKGFAEKWAATCDCRPEPSMLLSYATDHPFKRQEVASYNTHTCATLIPCNLYMATNCIPQYVLKCVIEFQMLLTSFESGKKWQFYNWPPCKQLKNPCITIQEGVERRLEPDHCISIPTSTSSTYIRCEQKSGPSRQHKVTHKHMLGNTGCV